MKDRYVSLSLTKCSWLLPIALFIVTFTTRVLVATFATYQDWGGEMQNVARMLATTGRFANAYGDAGGVVMPTAHVCPAYPVLLAAVYATFGIENRWPPRLLAITLTALTAALIPLVARRGGMGPLTGILAGITFALVPCYMVEMDGTWEQPQVALGLLVFALLTFTCVDHGWLRPRDAVAYGLLAGCLLLVSPVVLPAIAFAPLPAVLAWREPRYDRRLTIFLIAAVICLACLAPWLARNHAALGGFVPLRSNFGLELFIGNRDGADGTGLVRDGVLQPHPFMNRAERDEVLRLGELEYMQEKQRAAMRWIAAHPAGFLRLTALRVRYFWFPDGPLCLQSKPAIAWVISAYLSLVSVLALLGLVRLWRIGGHYRWIWTVLLLSPSLPYVASQFLIRYREPIHAIALILACGFVYGTFTHLVRPGD